MFEYKPQSQRAHYNPTEQGGLPSLRESHIEAARMQVIEDEIAAIDLQLAEHLPHKKRNYLFRRRKLLESEHRRLDNADYGRRIPDNIAAAVIERDQKRNFGRPNHTCTGVRPPHHIRHFETFKGPHTRDNPHTLENLEAPCKDCHRLAHTMGIPSGMSIEQLFILFTEDDWRDIEKFWASHNNHKLRMLFKDKIA